MKKKHGAITTIALASLLMVGCEPIDNGVDRLDEYAQTKLASMEVPFEWFKLDEAAEVETVNWNELSSIQLPKKDNTLNELKAWQKLVDTLEEEVTNEVKLNGFLERTRHSHQSFSGFASLVSDKQEDDFGDLLRSIYKTPYQFVQSMTLTGAGTTKNGKVLFVSLNVVNDEQAFQVYSLQLNVDAKNHIQSVKLIEGAAEQEATPTPLTEKSEWKESLHEEFSYLWQDIVAYPVQAEWESVTKEELTSWLIRHGVIEREASATAVQRWFKENEGDLSRAAVTGFVHTDDQANAITQYEVSYPVKNSAMQRTLTVHYDRGLNAVTLIEPGSPFVGSEKGEE